MKDNYIRVFMERHEQMKNIWGLDDEVVEGALELLEELDSWDHDAYVDYDNLAINAEIVERKDFEGNLEDALFTTENYVVVSW